MQIGGLGAQTAVAAVRSSKDDAEALLRWYRANARPFLEKNAPDVLPPLDNDADRLEKLLAKSDGVTICFLGHSGVGKSTLLNALVAESNVVLPAGGIGPLTALATEVAFREKPSFRVTYHKRNRLWRLIFALERLEELKGHAASSHQAVTGTSELNHEEQSEVKNEIATNVDADGNTVESSANAYVKQAQQIITGDQFGSRPLPYLIDALRIACGYPPKDGIRDDDRGRIERIQKAIDLADEGQSYQRDETGNEEFSADLKDHTVGFLAPIIEKIEVGWPSPLLSRGVTLVDLPGVGIAQDSYRRLTQEYIRATARAVILTIDRAGLTSETIELLRSSGYWDRLVGAVDDPTSDPCSLFVAVTKIDDVASQEWRDWPESQSASKPKRRDVYATTVSRVKERMKVQLADQLGNIGATNSATLQDARSHARTTILESLQIHPVSAPEYRKILRDDEDDAPFLRTENETGISGLRGSLSSLGDEEHAKHERQITEVMQRFREAASGELRRLEAMWRSRNRARQIEEGLKRELDEFLARQQKERDLRVGAFREFLESTAQSKIKQLVGEAREIAEDEVNLFLKSLRTAHWATLKAAVKRGGSFHGSRAINLPEDVAIRFQEPMAAVWSTKLLVDVRKRTAELAADQTKLVSELCDWAQTKIKSNSQNEVIEQQRQRISRHAEQMRQAGKEAVSDLRQTVKLKIADTIRKPIRRACDQFVESGNHIGPGVKNRIMELFEELARKSTKAAQGPATEVLEENFNSVRSEIKAVFNDWGDPLRETADLIFQRNLETVDESSDEERETILAAIDGLLAVELVSSPVDAHG